MGLGVGGFYNREMWAFVQRKYAFLSVNSWILYYIVMYVHCCIGQHEYESTYYSTGSPTSATGRLLCGDWSAIHWRGLFSLFTFLKNRTNPTQGNKTVWKNVVESPFLKPSIFWTSQQVKHCNFTLWFVILPYFSKQFLFPLKLQNIEISLYVQFCFFFYLEANNHLCSLFLSSTANCMSRLKAVSCSCFCLQFWFDTLCSFFQASLESEITRCGGMLNGFISSTEEILSRFITQYFPTQIMKSVSSSIY